MGRLRLRRVIRLGRVCLMVECSSKRVAAVRKKNPSPKSKNKNAESTTPTKNNWPKKTRKKASSHQIKTPGPEKPVAPTPAQLGEQLIPHNQVVEMRCQVNNSNLLILPSLEWVI